MRYVPKIESKNKWYTDLTRSHGGIHNQKKFKEAVKMLEESVADYRRPTLCHICFTEGDRAIYKDVLKRLCRGLSGRGVRYKYKAAFEEDGEKGIHLHLMLIMEHLDDGPNLYGLIDSGPQSLLSKTVDYFRDISSVKFYVAISKYSGKRFLPVSKTNAAVFDEAVEWVSYIYKVRSKEGLTSTIYLSSRDRASGYLH